MTACLLATIAYLPQSVHRVLLYIIQSQSVLWTWGNQGGEEHNILHVRPPQDDQVTFPDFPRKGNCAASPRYFIKVLAVELHPQMSIFTGQ